jgi:two-component system sensor histidine kinase/response regulator
VDYITKPFELPEVLARVRTHVHLRRTQLELAHSLQRLRDLERTRDDLVQMIVHDMRAPLTVLIASLSMLDDATTGAGSSDVRAAMQAADELNRMANDVLDVSRLDQTTLPVTRVTRDLVAIAASVRARLSPWDHGRVIVVRGDDAVMAPCDPSLVRRVLENLVGNAIKHTPAGTDVQIVVSGDDERARVEVLDAGAGIPPGARAQIFEKYGALRGRHDSGYHSVGLGLAFCRIAVEAHGGAIGVDEREGGGSRFWFELPR